MVMAEQLAQVAWAKLGLQPDPITGTVSTDLAQAKVAVDAVADLCRPLEGTLDAEDQRQLRNLVRDLQVNYVEKSKAVLS